MSIDNQIEPPQTLAVKENLSEKEVLERCHHELQTTEVNFTDNEAIWVICRLAELLGWGMPEFNISP